MTQAESRTIEPDPGAAWLATLFHRRWAAPVLAELSSGGGSGGGAKFVTLSRRLGASPAVLSATLEHLVSLGLVARPTGLGHPLRPEYVLSPQASPVAASCRDLLRLAEQRDWQGLVVRKWSMPIAWSLRHGPTRFTDLGERVPAITDRALSQSLTLLGGSGVVVHRRDPGVYALDRRSAGLATVLRGIVGPCAA